MASGKPGVPSKSRNPEKKNPNNFLQFQNKFVIVVQRTLGLLLFLYESFLFPTLSASHLMGVSNLLL